VIRFARTAGAKKKRGKERKDKRRQHGAMMTGHL
jgi:hypothetical protein